MVNSKKKWDEWWKKQSEGYSSLKKLAKEAPKHSEVVDECKAAFAFFASCYQKFPMQSPLESPLELARLDAECRLDDFLNYDYTEGLQPLSWVEGWLKRNYN